MFDVYIQRRTRSLPEPHGSESDAQPLTPKNYTMSGNNEELINANAVLTKVLIVSTYLISTDLL